MRNSQNALILKHLKRRSITQLMAWSEYNCFRLPSRIWDRKNGVYDGKRYPITSEMIYTKNGKHWAEYRMLRSAYDEF